LTHLVSSWKSVTETTFEKEGVKDVTKLYLSSTLISLHVSTLQTLNIVN